MQKLNEIEKLIKLFKDNHLTLINNRKATQNDIKNLCILILLNQLTYSYIINDLCVEIKTKKV